MMDSTPLTKKNALTAAIPIVSAVSAARAAAAMSFNRKNPRLPVVDAVGTKSLPPAGATVVGIVMDTHALVPTMIGPTSVQWVRSVLDSTWHGTPSCPNQPKTTP